MSINNILHNLFIALLTKTKIYLNFNNWVNDFLNILKNHYQRIVKILYIIHQLLL